MVYFITLTEKEIATYYEQALRSEPSLLVNYLVKEIKLFDEKILVFSYREKLELSAVSNPLLKQT